MNHKNNSEQRTKTAAPKPPSLPAWKVIFSIIQFRPWYWLIDLISVVVIRATMQVAPGLIIRAFLDMLTGNTQVGPNLWTVIALFAATFLGRAAGSYGFYYADVPIFSEAAFLLRRNLLKHILLRPGASPLPDSPGEAVSRFRNDVMEIPLFVLWFNDILSGLVVVVISIGMLVNISAPVTLIALTPVVLVGFIANAATRHIEHYRRSSRQATGKVTGFIGEFFGAIQVVKVAAAEKHVIPAAWEPG
jgi:ABC-type multidrug transport system fused ATPase/permease subunit